MLFRADVNTSYVRPPILTPRQMCPIEPVAVSSNWRALDKGDDDAQGQKNDAKNIYFIKGAEPDTLRIDSLIDTNVGDYAFRVIMFLGCEKY